MSNATLTIEEPLLIGENDHGYAFYVGRIGSRWLGYARETTHTQQARAAFASEGLPVEPGMAFVFPEVAEGYQMGLEDKEEAIRLTGAVAQDPEHGYGGIKRWFVAEELRGRPDDFRCEHCEQVGCDSIECREDVFYGEDW